MDSLVFASRNFGSSSVVDSLHRPESHVRSLVPDLLVGFADLEFCPAGVCVLAHGRFQLGRDEES